MRCDMLKGDFREVLSDLEDGSAAGVIADPPYYRKYLYLYQATFDLASRVLEPGGVLTAILPTWAMREAMAMDWGTLKWRWMIWQDQSDGSHARLCNSHKTVQVTGKPIGWWYQPKGPRDFSVVRDSFKNAKPNKKQHRWTQSETWAEKCLSLVRPGGLVVDPMAGTGTSLLVARRLGYPCVGVDIDESQVEIARANLGLADTKEEVKG